MKGPIHSQQGSSTVLIVIAITIVLGIAATLVFRDSTPPTFTLTPAAGTISQRPLSLELIDQESGLKSLTVTLDQSGTPTTLLNKTFEGKPKQLREEISLAAAGTLQNGSVTLRIQAVNGSLFSGKTEQSLSFEVDTQAPKFQVKTTGMNISRGGAGLVVYTLSEPVERTGLVVGDYFFPGYLQPNGDYLCFFTYPWDSPAGDFNPKLIALDQAGNEGAAGFNLHAAERSFRSDTIRISDNFLNAKMPQFADQFPQGTSNLDIFLKVNRDMRADNRKTLLEIGLRTQPEPMWQGTFLRQPRAATLSLFADHRTYYFQDQEIDQATHLGLDLASNEQAPIPAANHGRVAFAGFLGIYGNCVILDHGAGLQSLYAHLSSITVKEGDMVNRDQTIGLTGATGMAGGDHLHYEVLISGVSVNPIEWWDASWIANNITGKYSR